MSHSNKAFLKRFGNIEIGEKVQKKRNQSIGRQWPVWTDRQTERYTDFQIIIIKNSNFVSLLQQTDQVVYICLLAVPTKIQHLTLYKVKDQLKITQESELYLFTQYAKTWQN